MLENAEQKGNGAKRLAVLDIGGTSIKSGCYVDGVVIDQKEQPTNASRGSAYVMEMVKEILRGQEFDGIGISTAGQVNFAEGYISYANSNLPGYMGTRIRDILEAEFGVPVVVENDVNAAAIGEAVYGAGKDLGDFICLTYGTGVGGAIIMNGEIYRGSSFSAGEMGAMIIHPEDRRASEDMYSGCYEKYASTTGLVKRALQVDASLDNGRKIFAALDREDVRAAVDAWIDEITLGLVSLIHIFNPSGIVLGGGVMAQPYVLEQTRKKVMESIMETYRHVKIVNASLGNEAGMFGAAYLLQKKMAEKGETHEKNERES